MSRFARNACVWACMMCVASVAMGQEIIVPEEAAKDPDFAFQGEFVGNGTWPGGKSGPIGAHVIAQSGGKFKVVIYQGGLPGDGWKRDDNRVFMDGVLAGGVVNLKGKEIATGKIENGSLTAAGGIALKHTVRKSPTLGQKPPKGAVVLFDGTNIDHFPGATFTDMKTLQAGSKLKGSYDAVKIHIEFRLSWKTKARGQGRSNSGVFIGGIPEIQVLDSFGLEGAKNECGAFYNRRQPDVNMCLPPMQWQTYDVEFTKPGEDSNVLCTVRHNGVVIHKDYNTGKKTFQKRSLSFQAHGNRVQYNNVWMVERD